MVHTCIKCREFVIIDSNNSKNQVLIKQFEKKHKEHNFITLNREEPQGHYKEFS